ncbi:prepilin-type N-terminal cleavage/methylation domain-containing protein [Lactiplantibacillus plantarum]|uniref:prepilin-type N-terminal cleavage/methylation domain-containing protein n=1 Tax=Lactiplantibacillus plantarum TaxID=1590 RepID=UPI003B9F1945
MVKRQGFTLIETVAVLAIVASVAVIAVHRSHTATPTECGTGFLAGVTNDVAATDLNR